MECYDMKDINYKNVCTLLTKGTEYVVAQQKEVSNKRCIISSY